MKRVAVVLVALALASGCGGAGAAPGAKVAEAERTRAGLQGQDLPSLAPQAFAEAEQELRAAKEAERAGDSRAAELHAEHAVAAYQHAVALARLTRATEEELQAKEALTRAVEQFQRYAAARKAAEREMDDLEKQIAVAREAERPAGSGPADPERERARLVAAQSLATQARLLCSAARLVSAQAAGLAEAETAVTDLEKKLQASPKPAPIDAAARARASCLGVLTKARRAGSPDADAADALLGELSRATETSSRLAPSRDERGVVVTLRSLFASDASDRLSKDGEQMLRDLGKVAAAHPSFAVQVVIHDATPPNAASTALDRKRGEVITKALTDAGANASKTKVEQAGARAPVIDPSDAKRRAQNARVEVVFVSGG